jgi:uncharacterized protein YjdB
MFARCCVRGLLLLCLGLSLVGCTAPQGLDSIQVAPTTQALTVGQSAQLTATGTYGNANHQTTQNITSLVTWTSSAPSVASVTNAGLVAAVDAGTTTITATSTAFNGPTSASATITVTASAGGVAGGSIVSLAVVPGAQSVAAPAQTTQFLAIGTTSSGATVNLSNQVAWSSSSTQIATINATSGLATAVGQGAATISALYDNSSGGTVVGTATFTVVGGTTEKYTAVTITPASQALSASGQTSQLIALGTSGSTGLLTNVTNSSQIVWSSSIPSIATVSSTGLITGLAAGNSTITALLTNPDGSVVSNAASVAVSITAAPEPLLSLTIIPSSITVNNLQDTGQFLAIGTYSVAPYVRDVTNVVTWLTSFPNVFPVSNNINSAQGKENAGVVTAVGAGSATIIAEATSPDGSIQTATATFNCPQALANPNGDPPTLGSCVPGTQASALLSTLTVYNEGLDTTNWQVTAPSASTPPTPYVLHCGPGWSMNPPPNNVGGSVCTATYPVGATVVLTATGGNFGGWSYNCLPVTDATGSTLYTGPPIQNGPNYCKVILTSDDTVGGIFN